MQALNINSVLPFGINKGYTLREVFLLFPEYVEWVMENHSSIFIINPEYLPKEINPTPFNGSLIVEDLLNNFPILRNECKGIPYKHNSIVYAKKVMEEFNLILDTYEVNYIKTMQRAYEFYEIEYQLDMEAHRAQPDLFPIPQKKELPKKIEPVFFDFSERAYNNNNIKRNKLSHENSSN